MVSFQIKSSKVIDLMLQGTRRGTGKGEKHYSINKGREQKEERSRAEEERGKKG